MDNEVSGLMSTTIEDECKLELVPPGCHHDNVTEVTITTFKAHFIAIITGLPSNVPLCLWSELQEQAELTLNIPRPLHVKPKISARAYLFGLFNFDRTPQCHIKAADRGTWAKHSVAGWFLGSIQDHYHAFKCYIRSMTDRRVCDTVKFLHKHITQPPLTDGGTVGKAAHDLITALTKK